MKKILSILFILFAVAAVVSADGLPGTATLTLNTTVLEEVSHGFFDEKYEGTESFFESEAVNNTKSSINLSGANDLGYYNFRTNAPNQVEVSFALSSLSSDTGFGVWYVPYQLTITKEETDGTRFTSGHTVTSTLGSSALATQAEADPLSSLGGEVFFTTGSGAGFISLELKATFNSGNSAVIPAGDYSGSIIATITSL